MIANDNLRLQKLQNSDILNYVENSCLSIQIDTDEEARVSQQYWPTEKETITVSAQMWQMNFLFFMHVELLVTSKKRMFNWWLAYRCLQSNNQDTDCMHLDTTKNKILEDACSTFSPQSETEVVIKSKWKNNIRHWYFA